MRVYAFLAVVLLAAPAKADPVHDAALDYARYQNDVTELLRAGINSAADMDAALMRAARHDPAAVARGWIAYGGLAAAQSSAFVNGVRSRERAASRAAVIRQLRRDMTYARRRPPGANEALGIILTSAAADSARMNAAAHRYSGIAEARDMSGWQSVNRGDRDALLRGSMRGDRALPDNIVARLNIGALGVTPGPDALGGARFWDALVGRPSPAPAVFAWRVNPARQDVADRMLTIGGILIAEASDAEAERVAAVLNEPRTRECLEMEQLQFRQCASVAHDSSEDAHCLARHGLTAPGACFAALAQAP